VGLLALLLTNACSKHEVTVRPPVKLAVSSEQLSADGVPISLEKLREALKRTNGTSTTIWLYCEATGGAAPHIISEVLREVEAARMSLWVFRHSDYSDVAPGQFGTPPTWRLAIENDTGSGVTNLSVAWRGFRLDMPVGPAPGIRPFFQRRIVTHVASFVPTEMTLNYTSDDGQTHTLTAAVPISARSKLMTTNDSLIVRLRPRAQVLVKTGR